MTMQECYQSFDGDYEDTLKRLCSEALMLKLLKKFPEDTSYAALKEALAAGNYEKAFLAVHTLKGVALNMGFASLARSSSELTELLRDCKPCDYARALSEVDRDYVIVYNSVIQL